MGVVTSSEPASVRSPSDTLLALMRGASLVQMMDAKSRYALFGDRGLEACTAERVHFGSKLGIVVEYTFGLDDGRSCRAFGQVPRGDCQAAYDKARAKLETMTGMPAGGNGRLGLAHLAHAGVIMRAEGVDERIGDLTAIAADRQPSAALSTAVSSYLGGGAISYELLAHRLGKRAVLRARGDGKAGAPESAIVKLYKRNSSTAMDGAKHQAALSVMLGRDDSPIAAPVVIAEIPETAAFVMADVAGTSLRDLVGSARENAMVNAGAAIASLHGAPVGGLAPYGIMDEIDLLAGWTAFIANTSTDAGTTFARALERVCGDLRRCAQPIRAPIHRDFHERQIICKGGSATLIDFDTLRLGDPAQDLGNFLAHLRFADLKSGSKDGACAEAFLDGYRRTMRRGLETGLGNIANHMRATLLRLALINWFSERNRHLVDPLLEEVVAQ